MPIAPSAAPPASPGPISFNGWLRDRQVSRVTGWRWIKNGWLNPINISGRLYLNQDDIAQFEARATAGEFSKVVRPVSES